MIIKGSIMIITLITAIVIVIAVKLLLSDRFAFGSKAQNQARKIPRANFKINRGIRRLAFAIAVVTGIFLASTANAISPNQPEAEWTPVVVSTVTPDAKPVLGIDGKYHVVYELELSNATRLPATLNQIQVLDARDPSRIIMTYKDGELLTRLRALENATANRSEIAPSQTRLFLIDLAFDSQTALPPRLLHRFDLQLNNVPPSLPSSPSYTGATLDLISSVSVLGPPLSGKGWVAVNGCCAPDVGHRSTGLPINGRIYFSQRFAIDWVKLDDHGRIVEGDDTQVQNYTDYGAEVLAVADGTVVATLDTLSDQTPPNSPAPNTINLQNVLGNHVILDLGNNQYGLYAHLQKGQIKVKPGDRVRRGQVLGKLGNTGNSTAPHLHFHLMSGPTLGSNGLPYVIDSFSLAGQIPTEAFEASPNLNENWSQYLSSQSSPRQKEFPLYLTIADFP